MKYKFKFKLTGEEIDTKKNYDMWEFIVGFSTLMHHYFPDTDFKDLSFADIQKFLFDIEEMGEDEKT